MEKEPAAFGAEYVDFKLIKTRSTVQVVFEIPLGAADHAWKVLGGMPSQGESTWFGIARMKKPDATPAES
jgi:hypothetical protein